MTQLKVSVLLVCFFLGGMEAQGQPASLPVPPAPPSATRILVGHLVQGLFPEGAKPQEQAAIAVAVEFKSPPKRAADPDAYRRFVRDSMVTSLRERGWQGDAVDGKDGPGFVIQVQLTVNVKKSLMLAQAQLVRMPRSIWERLREPGGIQRANAAADVPLDLQMRSILGMTIARFPAQNVLYLRGSKLHHEALLSAPILAIRVRDYNNDRIPEVSFLQRHRLSIARYRKMAFQDVVAHSNLATQARPNGSKLRDPIGSLVHVTEADGGTLLLAASSDYSEPVAYRVTRDGQLRSVSLRVGGGAWPLYALGVDSLAGLDWPLSTDVLKGPVNELGLKNGSAMMSQGSLDGNYLVDVFPHWTLNPGEMVSRESGVEDGGSRVSWRPQFASLSVAYDLFLGDSEQGTTLREKHGTVVCLADLNLDGEPEVLATSTALAGDDTLTLYSKRETGYVPISSVRLTKENVRGRVTALAYGDIDRDGRSEFLVASNDGLRNYLGIVEVNLTL